MDGAKTLTAEEFKRELDERGVLRQRDAAKLLGVSESAISLYINGKRPIPPVVVVALRTVRKLRRQSGEVPSNGSGSKD